VCVIGDERAGKTTLIKSLQRKREMWFLSLFSRKIKAVEIPRTAGIAIIDASVGYAGDVVFCDFAGQPNFHKTHCLFFSESTTVYVLVVDVTKSDQELFDSSQYWLSLVKCSVGSSASNCVVIIGSRGDQEKKGGNSVLKRLYLSLNAQFKNHFSLSARQFLVDCRDSNSDAMDAFRKHIFELKELCLQVCRIFMMK